MERKREGPGYEEKLRETLREARGLVLLCSELRIESGRLNMEVLEEWLEESREKEVRENEGKEVKRLGRVLGGIIEVRDNMLWNVQKVRVLLEELKSKE